MILYVHGAIIRAATEAGVGEQIQQIEPWINLTFAGSLLATLFWVSLDYYTCKQHTYSHDNMYTTAAHASTHYTATLTCITTPGLIH